MASHDKISSEHSLPLVLISASDLQNARVLIKDLIDGGTLNDTEQTTNVTIWQIVNKYYRVNVEMYPVGDDITPPGTLAERLEAHIIYITEEEDDNAASDRAEQRWSRGVSAGCDRADVRLVIIAGTTVSPALLAWCRHRRYEPVPLSETADHSDDDDDENAPFPETYGLARARAAMHAHVWRGLERLDRPMPCFNTSGPNSSDDEYSGGASEDDEAAVERAEAFVEALGALGEAGQGVGNETREERLQRAERLVAAFCRALGSDLPTL